MADQKISELSEITVGEIDADADWVLASDMSASLSKKLKVAELMRAAAPYLSTVYDFATGALNPTVAFSRASAGYRYNSSGILVSEGTDVPRFEYDPVALTPRGLLIEDAITSNAQRSEELSDAFWAKSQVTVTADADVAPDGTTTMDKIVESAASSLHNVSRSLSVVAGTTYVLTAFAKAGERTWLCLSFGATGFGATSRAYFDLTNGVLGTAGAGITSHIESVGGGIYRCTAIMTATASAASNFNLELSTNGSTVNYAGDGTSGLFVWGVNVNTSDCSTAYIQTVAAAATRAADVVSTTNPRALTDGCWIIKGRTPSKITGGAVNIALQIDDGTNTNRRCLQWRTTNDMAFIATTAGVTTCLISLGTVAPDTDFAVAVRWADNNFAASLNGGAVVADGAGINPMGLTTTRIGRGAVGNYWNSTIRHIETRRTATNAELVLLSA